MIETDITPFHGSLPRLSENMDILENTSLYARAATVEPEKQQVRNPILRDLSNFRGKIGILGGTFDPIHLGHLQAATAAQRQLGLDFVFFVPNAQNPLKTQAPGADGAERLFMVSESIRHEPTWYALPIQLENELRYSADLTKAIEAQVKPESKLYLIIGADCVAQLPAWTKLDELRKHSIITPIFRPGTDIEQALNTLPADLQTELRTHLVPERSNEMSATAIRKAFQEGNFELLEKNLCPKVLQFIRARRLYR